MKVDFEKLYAQTYDDLYRFVASRVSMRHDAEDLVEDTYLRALSSMDRVKSNPRAWVFKIAANRIKNYYRDKKPMNAIPESIQSMQDVEHTILTAERARELASALSHLPDDDQILVSLRYFSHLSYTDIAQAMQITQTAARVRMTRALKKLKRLLQNGSVSNG